MRDYLFPIGQASGLSHPGRVKSQNQDAFACGSALPQPLFSRPEDSICFLALGDGLSQPAGGELAAAAFVEDSLQVLASLTTEEPGQPRQQQLCEALHSSAQKITALARQHHLPGMGTTALLATVEQARLHWCWLGDSRLYLARPSGGQVELQCLTRDHRLLNEWFERGEISAAELQTHPLRHVLSQALLAEQSPLCFSGSRQLLPGDLLLLCSDGLTGEISDPEITAILQNFQPAGPNLNREQLQQNLQKATRALLSQALQKGGHDNITILLFCFTGQSESLSLPPEQLS